MSEVKQEVRQFYDQVGWQLVSDNVYQNAHYEDLRPVAQEYIQRCHLRVARYLKPAGRMLLDAGSGPIQYPEYLEYSRNYQYRVCADISITALKEARKRIGEQGLFVVADIANLPFKPESFDGVVSLHTIHHLPEDEHLQAYGELYRVLAPGSQAAVVNGWPCSALMDRCEPLVRFSLRLRRLAARLSGKGGKVAGGKVAGAGGKAARAKGATQPAAETDQAKGTFTNRHDVAWIKSEVNAHMPAEIRVWRSVSVRVLRALVHPYLGGRWALRLLYRLEERYPHYFGERGQYPLIVIRKPTEQS